MPPRTACPLGVCSPAQQNTSTGTAGPYTHTNIPGPPGTTELLNLAYADHEIDGEYFTAIQKWMEGGFSGNLPAMGEVRVGRGSQHCLRRAGNGHACACHGARPVPVLPTGQWARCV